MDARYQSAQEGAIMFLPATVDEFNKLGWRQADIIIVSGDAYIDSPFSGAALVGKVLLNAGFKVAVISQPEIESPADITRLGSPRLYWGVTAGATDSMVANYSSSGRKRKSCDFTPGGYNSRRPDRACIVYTNLIKRYDRGKRPVVLGGIEASLRRFAHYDSQTDKIRRSLLFDAKADYIIYGMGEYPAVNLARALEEGKDISGIKGVCYTAKTPPDNSVILPPFEDAAATPEQFENFFRRFYSHASTLSGEILAQKCADRYVVQNPPYIMTGAELDYIHSMSYEREAHPDEKRKGAVKAVETVKYSIASHRGCFGECNFCAISIHQGRAVVSRSRGAIIREAAVISKLPGFKGVISDVGGPTANMYGSACVKMQKGKICKEKRCLWPSVCPALSGSQENYTELLRHLRKIKGIKKIRVSSGIRADLALANRDNGARFIADLAKYHTGGQIKLAPEHSEEEVLRLMGKPHICHVERFAAIFSAFSAKENKKQFISYYFMAAHPGCTADSMKKLNKYIKTNVTFTPEQAQIFTPAPSTWSACMYYTCRDYINGSQINVEKKLKGKTAQKMLILNAKH